MKCVVYVIRNLVNGKTYVGQTINFSRRKAGHLYAARKGCQRPLYRSIRKHGEENFLFEILEECDDSIINEREQYWVAQLDSFNPEKGYNLTRGGNQNCVVSDETRQKHSINQKGLPKTPEHRHNISVAKMGWEGLRGENNPNFGKEFSESTRKKLSEHASKRVGSLNSNSHLTEDDVKRIKQMFINGSRLCDIVREFGIGYSQASRIRNGQHWKHIIV